MLVDIYFAFEGQHAFASTGGTERRLPREPPNLTHGETNRFLNPNYPITKTWWWCLLHASGRGFSDAVVETLEFSSGSLHYYARVKGRGAWEAFFSLPRVAFYAGHQTSHENLIWNVWRWPTQRTLQATENAQRSFCAGNWRGRWLAGDCRDGNTFSSLRLHPLLCD